ncbi:MAG: hypothetical protein OEM02_08490 [Desulfobulbaceae bacterium]|nr:hypothetical protein [Desulfobulbaceae bacterium]
MPYQNRATSQQEAADELGVTKVMFQSRSKTGLPHNPTPFFILEYKRLQYRFRLVLQPPLITSFARP